MTDARDIRICAEGIWLDRDVALTMKGDNIMGFKSDIEIAQECTMQPITEIAAKAGIDDKYLEQYGKYKAKIDYNLLKESRQARWQADSCYSNQPYTGR